MSAPGLTATVSGKTWAAALDSNASAFTTEHDFPSAEQKPQGKGWRFSYHGLSADQVGALVWHLDTLADSWASLDAESRAEARACRADADRLRAMLADLPQEAPPAPELCSRADAAAVSRRLHLAGHRPLPSGTPKGREGIRVRRGFAGVHVLVDLDGDEDRAILLAHELRTILIGQGYTCTPVQRRAFDATKAAS